MNLDEIRSIVGNTEMNPASLGGFMILVCVFVCVVSLVWFVLRRSVTKVTRAKILLMGTTTMLIASVKCAIYLAEMKTVYKWILRIVGKAGEAVLAEGWREVLYVPENITLSGMYYLYCICFGFVLLTMVWSAGSCARLILHICQHSADTNITPEVKESGTLECEDIDQRND